MKKVFMMFMLLGLSACTVVGPGERGVRYNFGDVSNTVLQPGTHVWIPYFMGSQTLNTQIQAVNGSTNAGTKDQQEVNTKVTVNIQIDPEKVVDVVRAVGTDEALHARLEPLITESVNAVIAKFSAEEILTKRSEVKNEIEKLVKERITKYGVIVHDISLKDMQYSQAYSQAIEAKQVAEQKAKQAEYETLEAEQNSKAAIATARGEAESNRLKQLTLTDALIRYQMVQRWDGKLPQVQSGTGGMIMNLGETRK